MKTDTNPNAATLNALQAAYSQHNLEAALACMATDVIWDISGPATVPYTGVYYGHTGFSAFWTKLGQTVSIDQAGIQSQFIDGDKAVVLGGEEGVVRANGAPYHYDWAVFYRFNAEHKIVLMRQYYDPSRIQAALGAPSYPSQLNSPSNTNSPTSRSNKMDLLHPGHHLPSIPAPFTMPFYYASLTNIEVLYLVPAERVIPYLENTGLSPALFGGQAVVSYNFQLYAGQFSAGIDVPPEKWPTSGAGLTQELELNIVAYPTSQHEHIAQVSFKQFVLGDEQSKLLGHHRVHVPCDADVAIAAGMKLFGEPKFKTSFGVNLPSPNPVRQDTQGYEPQWVEIWGFRINDPTDSNQFILTCKVNLTGLTKYPSNPSAITEYGTHEGRLIGCRWNILQPMDTYFLTSDTASRVEFILGESTHKMKADLETLIGNTPARAVRTFNSAPAAIQSRAYYP